ncbi:hypothetical protein GE21DRAFT_5902 [Neurospora crassa]|uniref:Uncharacterized protein n=1 Tax=Neurospora crassa (strain ATCC 24698 / 74-OR23-1A / CBS 708.71 / DSM 1257 / FGSC 987) TaxID=367110 RepID=Q7S9V6_NEUCR|nr:hypothetical protein NCU06350 [Neurospora crassa OR74A]EAA33148.1 hypothetical protein NCU06350 [Neurospora crassa OR74A]KHE85534.1 hypothetical protein GE21DRAFT_5902 [Neurospora crassa]|eukprot:XP_962384.1 hypothetical protein NCU06350 [Neurospora crassa OR74A]
MPYVMSVDTDYISLKEPAWSEQSEDVHTNKAVPDQKVWPLGEVKKEKQKEILVGNEKSKVIQKVNNRKDLRKREKQLTQGVQVTTIVSKAVDTAKGVSAVM